MLTIEEEKDIVEKCKSDTKHFDILFNDNFLKILNFLTRKTENVELAQDLTSITFIKALEKIQQFNFKGMRFSAWLYKIATNEANDYFRKKKTKSLDELMEKEKFDPPAFGDPKSEIIAAQQEFENKTKFKEINKIILTLPTKYQDVISLRFFGEKQINEISEILGKSEGTIKSLLSRGLKKIKKKYEITVDKKMQPFSEKNVINIIDLTPFKI